MAVGPDDRVTAAEALRGLTVFANAKPVPAWSACPRPSPAGAPVPGLTQGPGRGPVGRVAVPDRERQRAAASQSGKELEAVADLSPFPGARRWPASTRPSASGPRLHRRVPHRR